MKLRHEAIVDIEANAVKSGEPGDVVRDEGLSAVKVPVAAS